MDALRHFVVNRADARVDMIKAAAKEIAEMEEKTKGEADVAVIMLFSLTQTLMEKEPFAKQDMSTLKKVFDELYASMILRRPRMCLPTALEEPEEA